MNVKSLSIFSILALSSCSLEQLPAPFFDKSDVVYDKHSQPVYETAQVERFDEFKTIPARPVVDEDVSYIDGNTQYDYPSSRVRSRPLPPPNPNDEVIRFGQDKNLDAAESAKITPRARPIIDEPSQDYAALKANETKPESSFKAPARGNDSDYIDMSKIERFSGGVDSANIRPRKKPAYKREIPEFKPEVASLNIKTPPPPPAPKVKISNNRVEEVKPAAGTEKPKEIVLAKVEPLETVRPKPEQLVEKATGNSKFIKPLNGPVIAEFGDKSDGTFNDGINIQASEGTPIKAAAGGSVVYSGNQLQGYGNLIIIRHDNGFLTAYAHLQDLDLQKGSTVSQGEVIGHVGKTGNVKEPQLHFGVRKGREPVNPKDFL